MHEKLLNLFEAHRYGNYIGSMSIVIPKKETIKFLRTMESGDFGNARIVKDISIDGKYFVLSSVREFDGELTIYVEDAVKRCANGRYSIKTHETDLLIVDDGVRESIIHTIGERWMYSFLKSLSEVNDIEDALSCIEV